MKNKGATMDTIISLAKRRGFIYQGSEIYGGLAGTWDYGPVGVELKENIKNLWRKRFIQERSDMYGIDAAILMRGDVWKASGHVEGFSDPLVECRACKRRFRADELKEEKCPECDGGLGKAKDFNMMFETHVGASQDSASVSYLRPETAQGIFVNFKNVVDSFHPNIPFGIAQVGKAFRNEIAPRDFLFRTREFEQMEIEWFVKEDDWENQFDLWRDEMWKWMETIGLSKEKLQEFDVPEDERAHYSKKTVDFEYEFPFGKSELYGLAYRGDFDLSQHQKESGVDLTYFEQESGEKFLPHVIEPTFGMDRTVLAVLCDAYTEEEVDGEQRVVLKIARSIAPIKVAVLPLMRKDELTTEAKKVYDVLKGEFQTRYDETGSIGKRYRRQDEIGTPLCVTIDYDSLEDGAVTVRDRDSMKQERIAIDKLSEYIGNLLE